MPARPPIEAPHPLATLRVTDTPDRSVFDAMFAALAAASRPVIGPTRPHLLVVPLHGQDRMVIGGLWGVTLFRWLHIELLVVPEPLRFQGIGTGLIHTAEAEARARQCLGIYVDAFHSQAAAFYQKLGFTVFGALEDCPPGHTRLYFQKRLT